MPTGSQDSHCILCGQVMDKWRDHALASQPGRLTPRDTIDEDHLTRSVARPTSGSPLVPAAPRKRGTLPCAALSGSAPFKLILQICLASSPPSKPVLKTVPTDRHSSTQVGIAFCSPVLEPVGGRWSDALRSVVAWVADECKRSGPPIGSTDASFKIAQRISCTLHRENARAILKGLLNKKVILVALSACLSWLSRSTRDF